MVRLTADQRKAQIISAAYDFANDGKFYSMSIRNIASKINCSRPTIIHYFTSLKGLRDEVLLEAINQENLKILGVALANKEPIAMGMSAELKKQAAKYLSYIG